MNVSLSCRNITAAYSGKLSDRPITEFVGPGSAPGRSRYCRPAYVAPQSAPSPRLRTVPAMRPARPDASTTRSASTTFDPILTPTARVCSTSTSLTFPVMTRTRGSVAARRRISRSNTIRRQCSAAARPLCSGVVATDAPADTKVASTSGISSFSASTTWPRKLWACWNCITPLRRHSPRSGGPGSRSTTTTFRPRRASAMAVNRPVGPAPMMTVRTVPPN